MKPNVSLVVAFGVLGASLAWGQPPPNPGASLQAAQDPGEAAVLARCKNPPPPRGPRAGGAGARPAGGPAAAPKDYSVTAIPGVIAAGQRWTMLWQQDGNVADGIVGTDDGGLLIAQNDRSDVLKLEADGKSTVAYDHARTAGAVSISKSGTVFVVERALKSAILELAPQRRVLADRYEGDPLDCLGGVLNDLTADSKGGVYFTNGGLYYAAASGVVTRYGENLRTNGIILSPDEKTLYVTNGGSIAAFDVQPDGALRNQRELVKLPAGFSDGSTVDGAGRLYVSGGPAGVHVIGPDGAYLGAIPTPFTAISVAFGGPGKMTLYAAATLRANGKQSAEIYAIPMLAQGYKDRAK
jgi:sugar lactone lactonase YvrE